MTEEPRPAFIITAQRARAEEWLDQTVDYADCWTSYAVPLIKTNPTEVTISAETVAATDWIMFTSQTAVDCFFSTIDRQVLAQFNGKWAVVGKNTSRTLQKHGYVADLIPKTYAREELLTRFQEENNTPKRILFPRGDRAHQGTIQELMEAGHHVTDSILYKTVSTCDYAKIADIVRAHKESYFFFASPSAVTSFVEHQKMVPSLPGHASYYIPIGGTTAKRLEEVQLPICFLPSQALFTTVIEELHKHLKRR